MIKSIRLVNFFSFKDTTIDFEPDYNILIGVNGSGKSNLLKALTLLKEGISGAGLKALINNKWGGIDEVAFFDGLNSNPLIELTFILDSHHLKKFGYQYKEDVKYYISLQKVPGLSTQFTVNEKISVTTTGFTFLDISNGKGTLGERIVNDFNNMESVQYSNLDSDELYFFNKPDSDRYYSLYSIRQALREIEIYPFFDTSPESKIRKPVLPTQDKKLNSSGGNLAQILNTIKINSKPQFLQIVKYLHEVNVAFTGFDFNHIGSNIELLLEEDKLRRSVHITHISDGTLRFLCLLSILLNQDKGSVVCIDEPELGLHPDMLFNLAKLIKQASKESLIIVSTHSEILIDNFDIKNVRVLEKGENNNTVIKQYSEEEFKSWNESYSVGKLWRQGHIGGNRW